MPVSELEKNADRKIRTPRRINKLLVEMLSNEKLPNKLQNADCKG
jgi:hypothetical protein|tara:strand:+ start:3548 stop:3682 length:135 start_codon:yes stop_codon:yes gene_type:complete